MNKRVKQIIQWTLQGTLIAVFLVSSGFKLSGLPETKEMAMVVGGANNLIGLGILEIVIAIVFIIPRTKVVGLFLMMAYFGGAMAAHLMTGESILVPTVIQVLIWLTGFLVFPELKGRLLKNA